MLRTTTTSLRQQLVDDRFDARHERRVDRERSLRAGVIAPAHRQSHRREAGRRRLVDEVVGDGEAPRAFGGRLEHVAEVHAASDRGRGRRGARGRTGRGVVRHRWIRTDVRNVLCGSGCARGAAAGTCARHEQGDGRQHGTTNGHPAAQVHERHSRSDLRERRRTEDESVMADTLSLYCGSAESVFQSGSLMNAAHAASRAAMSVKVSM